MASSIKEVERAFGDAEVEYAERDGVVAVRSKKKWQERDEWMSCNEASTELGGKWDKEKRMWLIPLEEPKVPANQEQLPKEESYSHLKPGIGEKVKAAEAESSQSSDKVAKKSLQNSEKVEMNEGYQLLPLERIMFPAKKLRQSIDENYISELTHTIWSQGVIEPILVRPRPDGWFEVVAGEQRVRASKAVGMKNIPAIVRNLSDWEAFETGLTENLQRKDLSDYEIARALKRALTDFPDQFPDQKTLAFSLGKSEDWVSEHLAILELEGKIPARGLQEITQTQAREIRRVSPERREAIIKEVAESGTLPSSREIEAKAKTPEAKPLPCDSCSNDFGKSGTCGRMYFGVDGNGNYVCEYQNKDLAEGYREGAEEDLAIANEGIPESTEGYREVPPTKEVKAKEKENEWWAVRWVEVKDFVPQSIIEDVDAYVIQGGEARKKKFVPYYLEALREQIVKVGLKEAILREADTKLSNAIDAEAKQ